MVDKHQTTGAAHVVVGTDGTEIASRAVAWAASEARLRGVPLRIVHAAPYVMDAAGRRRATAILGRAYTVAHQHEPHVPAHTQRIDGQPVRALVDASHNAQLLVVGMRGEGPGGMVIGSTALAVSGAASCPVTVVRGQRHAADTAAPVLLGLEDIAIDAHAVTAAFAAAQRRRAPLVVLHAQHDSLRDRVTGRNAAEDELAEQLAPWRSQYPQLPVEVRLVPGGPVDELLRAAATARLVVVGTHGRGAPARLLLGSTSRAIVRYSPCPVTVVRWDAVVGDVAPEPSEGAAQAGIGGPPRVAPLPDRAW
ncbi:MAG: universal stress protein [Pseudonocardiaceae bacterium]